MDEPGASAEADERYRDKDGLVGRKPSEIADPRSADAEAEQNERQDAARRRGKRAKQPAHS